MATLSAVVESVVAFVNAALAMANTLSAAVLSVVAFVMTVAAVVAAVIAGFCLVVIRVSRFFFAVSAAVFFVR